MFGRTWAVLEQHQRDCREDRDRTQQQFNSIQQAVEKLDNKIVSLDSQMDAKHTENTEKLDKILRYVWFVGGAALVLSTLLSHGGVETISRILTNGP